MEIETKHNIGDKVFVIHKEGIIDFNISNINTFSNSEGISIAYGAGDGMYFDEQEIFNEQEILNKLQP